ncbi:MAG TPA: hypothetical protein VJN67_11500 [Stellaceae bacterium]|nr:hypothetical protein [Stellaceae bacterium]
MTMLTRARSREAITRRLALLLRALLVAAGASGLALPAAAETTRPDFTDGVVPIGFPIGFIGGSLGWPVPQPDLLAALMAFGQQHKAERLAHAESVRAKRYEPPTSVTLSSGVTIVRGPGSRHTVSP